jgi:hypothetical protein
MVLSSSISKADEALTLPKEDNKYKYYLGIAENMVTYKEAVNQAFEQAVSDAIRENFGFSTSITSDTYSTESDSQILKRFRQNSQNIELKGFERIDMRVENDSNKYKIQMLYRYDKTAIQQELQRIKSDVPNLNSMAFEAGGATKNNLGGLQVITDPPNASIYLNDERFLKSPLMVKNQIAPNKYTLVLDHPAYETITEEIIILPNEVAEIEKTLTPAFGYLNIESSPENADVYINNKHIGRTPIDELKYLATEKFTLRLEHPKALTQTIEGVWVDKNSKRKDSFSLKLKPGKLEIEVEPKPDSIFLDGSEITNAGREIERPSGRYSLLIKKSGHDDFTESIDIEPNEKTFKKVKLNITIETPKPEYSEPWKPLSGPFTEGLSLQGKVFIDSTGSFLEESEKGTIGLQTEFSLGHYDWGGIFAYGRTGKAYRTSGNYYYTGEVSVVDQKATGFWLSLSKSDYDNSSIQLGVYREELKYITFLDSGTDDSKLPTSGSKSLAGVGAFLNYNIVDSKSLTFDFRFGGTSYRDSKNSTKGLQGNFYLSIGVGIDLFQAVRYVSENY